MYELKAKTRLCAQALVSAVGLYLLGGLSSIDFGFFILQNPWITNALAFLGIIWFINLYNFLDGIDGYAGMEAVFLAFSGGLLFGGLGLVAGFIIERKLS
jgi:Fuc2NAc and GlcNAc transferase